MLGLLTVSQESGATVVRFEKGKGGEVIDSPPLVTMPGENRPRQFGAFLETLALAIPYSADAGKPDEMLGIFHTLIELGRNRSSRNGSPPAPHTERKPGYPRSSSRRPESGPPLWLTW